MKAKVSISLLAAIILTAGFALAQQPTPPPTPPPSSDEPLRSFSFFVDGGGFLGVYGEDVNRENMGKYHLSQPRGVGITQVVKDSPAEKAGLRKDDVILRLDGDNVTSVRKLNRLVAEIAPDQSVRITISRGGAEQELTATIAKRNNTAWAGDLLSDNPKAWKFERPLIERRDLGDLKEFGNFDNDFSFVFGGGRRIGASTMELTKQLADYFGITGGQGVLVTSVAEDGPAAKSGLKAGDVITAIDGEAVDSPGDLSRALSRKKEGDVTLTIIRNRAQQTIRVTPREGGFTRTIKGDMARTIRDQIRGSIRDQVGRQIVIPRIEFPAIPDVNISVPAMDIAIPRINVNVPRVRVATPRIRILRGVYGPI
jgi:membrane-associated protease RseP (regulator of RpoE activity)